MIHGVPGPRRVVCDCGFQAGAVNLAVAVALVSRHLARYEHASGIFIVPVASRG